MPTKRNTGAKPAPASNEATPGGVAEVKIGRRYSPRKALSDRYGPQAINSESHQLLRPAELKAWALRALHAAGIDTGDLRVEHSQQNEGAIIRERVASAIVRPLQFVETHDDKGRFSGYRIAAGGGHEHDDLPTLAARVYELAREVELSMTERDPAARAWYAGRAHAIGYELGRLSMLARVYEFDAETGARGGKPTRVDHDAVRRHHARLAGEHDATSQTASAFGISTRQVRNILKAKARPT